MQDLWWPSSCAISSVATEPHRHGRCLGCTCTNSCCLSPGIIRDRGYARKRYEASRACQTGERQGYLKRGPKLKSTAPTGDTTGYGARPGSLHRVFLMRDAGTGESFKYGFAEFWTVEDATAAMTKFQKSRSFTVAACPVTVASTHMGVFLPEEREVVPAIEHMSFNPLFNPSLRVRYRDYHLYPSQQIVTEQPPEGDRVSQTREEEENDKKSKKRKADGNLAASSTKKSAPVMAGRMAMWQQKSNELREEKENRPARPARPGKAEFSDVNRTPLRINLSGSGADMAKPQSAIKISISGVAKLDAPETAALEKQTSPDETGTPGSSTQPAATSEEPPVSYVDRDRLMCLICMRKYKSVDEVNIHERSRNHKTATENEDQVKAALPRLAVRDKRLQKQIQENPDAAAAASQYRDRAKERRAVYNQPTKPTTATPGKPKSAPKVEDAAPAPKPAQSKGAGMLAKMGWSTGEAWGPMEMGELKSSRPTLTKKASDWVRRVVIWAMRPSWLNARQRTLTPIT
ncbi:hypothetical protein NXS19_005321 [Fusarium pseudograminearum]|nr:hypothetical protein NXS19_005321 [Fusarium pseudograminearum]